MESLEEIIKEKEFMAKAIHLIKYFPTARKTMEDMIELAERIKFFETVKYSISGNFSPDDIK